MVFSGHGLQPYWTVDGGDITDTFRTADAKSLSARFRRLVDVVAEARGVTKLDNVADLARVLRTPNTVNIKRDPVRATLRTDSGGLLSVIEIDERLTEHGIDRQPDDTRSDEELSNPDGWTFGARTCSYVRTLVTGLVTDGPRVHGGPRNPWACSQAVRLCCAWRLGCISENDFVHACNLLETRLGALLSSTEPRRPLRTYEMRDVMRLGRKRAAAKTDEAARAELGSHNHGGTADDFWGTGPASEQATGNAENSTTTDDAVRRYKFPDGQRPTDIGNAARLLRHADGRLRYVHAWGKWIVYRHGRWIIDEKDALVTEIAKQVATGLFTLAAETAATNLGGAKPIWKWALKSCAAGTIAAMIRLARGAPGILVDHEQLDAIHGCSTSTTAASTCAPEATGPRPRRSVHAAFARGLRPDATAPLWEACLERLAARRHGPRVRASPGGRRRHRKPTETVDIDYGGGGNGKSKFHGAIQTSSAPTPPWRTRACWSPARFEQHPTVIADLFRRRLAVASETKQAEDLDDESVKNLTGGDRLKGRRMREDAWEFWPTHTLIMFSNHKPTVAGRDEGIWRRLRLVPWQVTIPENERDEHLAAKLQAEAPGILQMDRRRRGPVPPRRPRPAARGARRHRRIPGRRGRHRAVHRRGARDRHHGNRATEHLVLLQRHQGRARRLVRRAKHHDNPADEESQQPCAREAAKTGAAKRSSENGPPSGTA